MKKTIPHLSKPRQSNILIAEDSQINQLLLCNIIAVLGHTSVVVDNGLEAIAYCKKQLPDLILLDMIMPGLTGIDVLKELKREGFLERVPVIVISGIDDTEDIAACIRLGANDYLVKPFNNTLLKARIESCLERKHFREREEEYYKFVEEFNDVLEQRVNQQVKEITQSHLSTIFAMSKLAESRDSDTGTHLENMREFCRILCMEMSKSHKYKFAITHSFIEDMYIACPLHDLGKVAIPDAILQKPGKLDEREWDIMKQHTLIGANTLREVHEEHPTNSFIRMGIEIAESHHEKWNGEGYPCGLKAEEIPLSGRILSVIDVYDALTSKRCYKKAYSHEISTQIILDGSETHFDPDIIQAFEKVASQFRDIKSHHSTIG